MVNSSNTPHLIVASSFVDAVSNIDIIIDSFIKYGVLVIRGHEFTTHEQQQLTAALGDKLGWNVNSNASIEAIENSTYNGGHSNMLDKEYNHGPNDYVLDWHIEQVFYVDPILAGIWNMTTFTADSSSGNTIFVDSNLLYSMLSTEDQSMLDTAIVVWDKPATVSGPFYTPAVSAHPISGSPTIRVETDRGCYSMPKLYKLNDMTPTQEEIDNFDKILIKLKDYLTRNLEIRITQQWQQNDLLIVDLFRMYHAVLGGFKYGERLFTGIGVRPINNRHDCYTEMP